MKRNPATLKRCGVSLVELLVVMSAATVILTLSTGLIHRLMHAQSKARALADVERTTLRLGNDFRRDVHQALRAVTDKSELAGGVFIRLENVDGSWAEYRLEETTIRRVQAVSDRVVAHEEYSFGEEFALDAQVENERLVTLTITSRGRDDADADANVRQSIDGAKVDLQVVAALGQRGAK